VIRSKQDRRPLRIAYGRIFHEANSYSPLKTERSNFEDFHFYRGEDVASLVTPSVYELGKVLRKAELTGFHSAAKAAGNIECVPLMSALAVPSGPLSQECFAWMRDELRGALERVGEVDAVYMALHGSMRVSGLDQAPEAVILADLRDALGSVPIAASFDLHANLTPAIVDHLDLLEAYRTNPHRDLYRTGRRAGRQLIAMARGEVQPTRAWRKLPMLLGGGTTIDFLHPMRGIFMHIKRLLMRRDVLSAHVCMVHPFTDAPDLGWAVHVCTDDNQALADSLADELADRVWKVRKVDLPDMKTPAEAIEEVRRSRVSRALGQVSVVDTCDIVGAGSTGGSTHLLDALVREAGDLTVYVPMHDPRLVDELWERSPGDRVESTVRGTPGLPDQPEVPVAGRIGVRTMTDFGRTVVLEHENLRIAVTEKPPGTLHPRFWADLGLSPWHADAIVQKFFFHYRLFYAPTSRRSIPVMSKGPSSLDNVRKRHFDEPMWPQSPISEWRSFDHKRRVATP